LAGVAMGPVVGAVWLVLALVGAGAALWRGDATTRLIALWAVGVIVVMMLITPMEWQRYYVPCYPALGLLGAAGAHKVLMLIYARRQTAP
jgi:hypothetical protein